MGILTLEYKFAFLRQVEVDYGVDMAKRLRAVINRRAEVLS
jgi:hypothetical protein